MKKVINLLRQLFCGSEESPTIGSAEKTSRGSEASPIDDLSISSRDGSETEGGGSKGDVTSETTETDQRATFPRIGPKTYYKIKRKDLKQKDTDSGSQSNPTARKIKACSLRKG